MSDTYPRFTRTLVVINESLTDRRNESPYSDLLAACDEVLRDRDLGVEVYDHDPDNPIDYFTIRYREGNFELVTHGRAEADVLWRVSSDYLTEVSQQSQRYTERPELLDWDWLASWLRAQGARI